MDQQTRDKLKEMVASKDREMQDLAWVITLGDLSFTWEDYLYIIDGQTEKYEIDERKFYRMLKMARKENTKILN